MFVNWNTWVTLKIGNIDRWTVSWIRLEMWRWGNWISCRKELDFIKPQRREHAILILVYKITKMMNSWKSLKSGEVSEMAVNWVRFPWCSAGPTSGDVISSNISRNHSTIPFSALLCKVQQCFTMSYNSPPAHTSLQSSTAHECRAFHSKDQRLHLSSDLSSHPHNFRTQMGSKRLQ